nr:DUF6531 domain-containing protein [Methylosinus sp. Sm6]
MISVGDSPELGRAKGGAWRVALTNSAQAQEALSPIDVGAAQNLGLLALLDQWLNGAGFSYWGSGEYWTPPGLGTSFLWSASPLDLITFGAGLSSAPPAQTSAATARNRGGSGATSVADPINYATGNAYDSAVDYATAGPFPIVLARYYNSGDSDWRQFGRNWRSSYSRSVSLINGDKTHAAVTRDDGQVLVFSRTIKGCWYYLCQYDPWTPPAYSSFRLEGDVGDGNVVLMTDQDEEEVYDASGKFLFSHNRAGVRIASLGYDEFGRLSKASDPFGRVLSFFYNDWTNKISKAVAPDGGEYIYSYDGSGNLISVKYPDNSSRKYLYEDGRRLGAVTGVIDENGSRYTSYSYDDAGRAVSTEHAGGVDRYTLDYSNQQWGSVTVTTPLGAVEAYKFSGIDGFAKPLEVQRRVCATCPTVRRDAKVYDDHGNLTSYTDFNGNQTTTAYDHARNLPTSTTVAAGTSVSRTITTDWRPEFRLPAKISDYQRDVTYEYDPKGNMLSRTVASGSLSSKWSYVYNGFGLVYTETDPLGHVTKYNYDDQRNVIRVTNALGHATEYTDYDANGRPRTIKDPNGVVTTLTYNFRGQVTSSVTLGQTTTYTYDKVGQLVKLREPAGAILDFDYDKAHRLTSIRDRAGNRIVYTLDVAGNRIKEEVFDPNGALAQTRSRIYDGYSRLFRDIGAEGHMSSFWRDANDNITAASDSNGYLTRFAYDAQNRLSQTTDPLGAETIYGYDRNGRLAKVTDPRGLVTSYVFNRLDKPERLSSRDTGVATKTYDPAGNALTSTDARGQTTRYDYDKLNRPAKATYADGSVAIYRYDQGEYGIGRLSSLTDSTGTTSFAYDAFGHVVQKTQTTGAVTLVTQWIYHPGNGRLLNVIYPSGAKLVYSNDSAGRPIAIGLQRPGQATAALIGSISYAAFGAVASWDTGASGASYVRSFDLDGRIAKITSSTGNVLTYDYDAGSRIKSIAESGRPTKVFAYDRDNRLTKYASGSTSILYAYDASGNRISAGDVSYNVTPTSNRLISIEWSTSGQAFSYLPSGVMTKQSGVFFLAYDARNRLVGASVGALTASYGLNDLGQRVTKTRATIGAGDSTAYLYDLAGHLLGTYDASGAAIEEIVWLGDLPVATLQGGAAYSIMPDHLGAPHEIVTAANQRVWLWDHDPFGNGAPVAAASFSHDLRFPGRSTRSPAAALSAAWVRSSHIAAALPRKTPARDGPCNASSSSWRAPFWALRRRPRSLRRAATGPVGRPRWRASPSPACGPAPPSTRRQRRSAMMRRWASSSRGWRRGARRSKRRRSSSMISPPRRARRASSA